jgi:cytoskeletal protein RodZ
MSILRQLQQVEFTPVEQTPVVASSIDPLAPAPQLNTGASGSGTQTAALAPTRNNDALDRLYRPEALDVPVFTPRDAPIVTIDPGTVGTFATGGVDFAALNVPAGAPQVQVVDGPAPEVVLFAVNPTWVRVRSADGSILFEKVLEKGENYALPVTEETPVLRAGNSGSLYFKVNGQIVGPAGQGATTVNNVQLASADLSAAYSVADPLEDSELFALLENLDAPDVLPRPRTRPIESIAAAKGSVSLVASQPSWVRITDAKGTRVFEKTLQPGEQYTLPADVDAPLLRAG